MGLKRSVIFLLMCAVCRALGRANDVNNLGITGGHRIRITDAPYMAGLFDDFTSVCGGSIVHEKFILTSAYCAKVGKPIERVHVGSNHVELRGVYVDVEKAICHDGYVEDTCNNDICLLKLRDAVVFSKRVAKVELVHENIEMPVGTMVNVTGWGNKSGTGDKYPLILQQATISVKSDEDCLRVDPTMTGNTFCAGTTRRDACDGDAGGPLTQNNMLVGIVSYSTSSNCGTEPSFYTKVSKYITWINTTINNNL